MNSLEKVLAKLPKVAKRKSPPLVSKRQIMPSKINQPYLKALLAKNKKSLPKTMEAYKDNNKEPTINKYITTSDTSIKPKKEKYNKA